MSKFRIQCDHPYCDVCALPNSGQVVAYGELPEAMLTEAVVLDPYAEAVLRVCLECAASTSKPESKLFAPLQADVYQWFQPSSREELGGWLDELQEQLYARFS